MAISPLGRFNSSPKSTKLSLARPSFPHALDQLFHNQTYPSSTLTEYTRRACLPIQFPVGQIQPFTSGLYISSYQSMASTPGPLCPIADIASSEFWGQRYSSNQPLSRAASIPAVREVPK